MASQDVKYNIYYKAAYSKEWILSNSTPLSHNDAGNSHTITGLQSNALYHIAVVAGVETNGVFVPLLDQAIPPAEQGSGDVNRVTGLPYYIIKTFSP